MIFFNKKLTLLATLLSLGLTLLVVEELGFCKNILGLTTGCALPADGNVEVFLGVLSALLAPSLIVVFFSSSVFQIWKKFALLSIPAVLIVVFWMDKLNYGGGGMPGQLSPSYIIYPVIFLVYYLLTFVIIFQAWQAVRLGKQFSASRVIVASSAIFAAMVVLIVGWFKFLN